MAKQKTASANVTIGDSVKTSDEVIKEHSQNKPLSGADVVTLVSCLDNPQSFDLERLHTRVVIPSAKDTSNKKAILRADGRSIMFTLPRSVWEALKAAYKNTAAFENGFIFECSDDQYKDSDVQKELAVKKTGYEAQGSVGDASLTAIDKR